ncbi:glycosidase, partial [bacterium]|nr:glycosidase [bacterium]
LVIFPVSQNESRGIEDLRLVKFTNGDGSTNLCGTYTAFNGYTIFPTMLVIRDNGCVQSHSISGQLAQNKGMALFPRKIKGKFIMSGRLDGENLYILESDNPLVWNEGHISQEPKRWWQFSVIGNCGSPIETKEGWLMLTHGVGPMRQYCIGAVLLDLEDPARIIGELEEPLISPADDERVGYVPNVVYTCGAMIHNKSLIIPYAVSDVVTKFARVDMEELLTALRSHG